MCQVMSGNEIETSVTNNDYLAKKKMDRQHAQRRREGARHKARKRGRG